MAKLKMKKTSSIMTDTITVIANSYMNKLTEKYEAKSKIYAVGIPLLIYLFGDSIVKKIKMFNSDYITANALEKALRNFAKGSNISLLSNQSKFIQSEDDLLMIENEEDVLMIEAETEEYIMSDDDELIEYSEIGDNVEVEVYEELE